MHSLVYAPAKRVFDFVVSLGALLFFSPVLLIVYVCVRIDSPGGAFYIGQRTGVGGRPFGMYKFRTMVLNAESIGGPSTALNDPRLTRIGRFLRKSKLDELPQLFNILRGDMSFVGPRPQVARYTDLYNQEELKILTVRPGLTDYASIHFVDMDQALGSTDVDAKYLEHVEPVKNKLRLKYVHDMSLRTDLSILAMTMLALLGFRKSWNTENSRSDS